MTWAERFKKFAEFFSFGAAITPPGAATPEEEAPSEKEYTSTAPVPSRIQYKPGWKSETRSWYQENGAVWNFGSDALSFLNRWSGVAVGMAYGAASAVFASGAKLWTGIKETAKVLTKIVAGVGLGVFSAFAGMVGINITAGDITKIINTPTKGLFSFDRLRMFGQIISARNQEAKQGGLGKRIGMGIVNLLLLGTPRLLSGIGAGLYTARTNALDAAKNLGSGALTLITSPIYGPFRGAQIGYRYGITNTYNPLTTYRVMREVGGGWQKAERIGFQKTYDSHPIDETAKWFKNTRIGKYMTGEEVAAAKPEAVTPAATSATAKGWSNVETAYSKSSANVTPSGRPVAKPGFDSAARGPLTGESAQPLTKLQTDAITDGIREDLKSHCRVKTDASGTVFDFTGPDKEAGESAVAVKDAADKNKTPVDIVLSAKSMEAAIDKMAKMDDEVLETLDQVEIGTSGELEIIKKGSSRFKAFCDQVRAARLEEASPSAIPPAPPMEPLPGKKPTKPSPP